MTCLVEKCDGFKDEKNLWKCWVMLWGHSPEYYISITSSQMTFSISLKYIYNPTYVELCHIWQFSPIKNLGHGHVTESSNESTRNQHMHILNWHICRFPDLCHAWRPIKFVTCRHSTQIEPNSLYYFRDLLCRPIHI